MMLKIIIYIAIFSMSSFLIYLIILEKFQNIKLNKSKLYIKVSYYLLLATKKNLIPKKFKFLTPLILILVMLILGFLSFIIFYMYIKIVSTAIILSIPFAFFPLLFLMFVINKEKSEIIKILPMYVVNLKNYVSKENNIVKALRLTSVQEPLKKYMDKFNYNVSNGKNVVECLNLLKAEVNINTFSNLINACEVCYINGGEFTKVLEEYLKLITKENVQKETTKEKAYSDILTLIIMLVLNVFCVVIFVFGNLDYLSIMRETLIGRGIMSINALSYVIIAYFIVRIYKEE